MNFVEFFGNKVRAKDIVFKSQQTLEDNLKWKEVGWCINGYKTINVDTTNWNEMLLVCCVNGADNANRRALASTVIPRAIFAVGYEAMSEGRHQAYYNSTYRAGVDITSNSQVRIYASSSGMARLYYR